MERLVKAVWEKMKNASTNLAEALKRMGIFYLMFFLILLR